MKHILLPIITVSALCLSVACQRELTQDTPKETIKTITVHTGDIDTKTAVYFDGEAEKYKVTWKAGDRILLFEFSDNNAVYALSDCLAEDAVNAAFPVSFDEEPGEGTLQYLGVYPWVDDIIYASSPEWAELWGSAAGTGRFGLVSSIPSYQRPSSDSFDPEADVLFSELKEYESRPDDISLAFARVGSIVKITLKGLPAGQTVTRGDLYYGDSWLAAGRAVYDPLTKKVAIAPAMPIIDPKNPKGMDPKGGYSDPSIHFEPEDLVVDQNGEAVIWLRTLSGTLTDYFSLYVTLESGFGPKGGYASSCTYGKEVHLAKGKSISFKEGQMTSFSVNMERQYDVDIYLASYTATAHEIQLQCGCDLDGAIYETGSFGVIWGEDYDTVENLTVETASPDRIAYLEWDENGAYLCGTVRNLKPSTNYYFRSFAILDGKAYYRSYPFSVKTDKTFEIPEAVDLGLPSGTKWASFNLGSTEPTMAGDYFAFGETTPAKSFYTYSNKYWEQTSYYDGWALKYADDMRDSRVLDLKMVLEPQDDAATQLLGSPWRTPTVYDFQELIDNCDFESVQDENGVYVDKYTARDGSGNYILLPPCGNWHWQKYYTDEHCYMTSSLCHGLGNALYYYSCGSYHHSYTANSNDRCYFYNIRPVKGGTVREYEWTAHVDEKPHFLSSTAAELQADFYNEEAEGYTYYYEIHIEPLSETNESSFRMLDDNGKVSRNGKATLTDLVPGKTYYYRAHWYGLKKEGYNTYIKEDGSEWRSFTMPTD